jgi:hypothetical protein
MRVLTAVVTLVAFATFFSLPAWAGLRRRGAFFWWDWGASLYPVLFWLGLYAAHVGSHHRGNFMELALAGMAVMPASYARLFALDRRVLGPRGAAGAAHAFTLGFALLLRLVMPALP